MTKKQTGWDYWLNKEQSETDAAIATMDRLSKMTPEEKAELNAKYDKILREVMKDDKA